MMTRSVRLQPLLLVATIPSLSCDDGRLEVLEAASSGDSAASGMGATDGTAGGASAGGGSAVGSAGASDGLGAGGAPLPTPFVLDDFEDGNTEALNIPEGYWYTAPDESDTCTTSFGVAVVENRPSSAHAIRARGGNCTQWGSLIGLDLGGTVLTFDASSFDELRFWARSEPGGATSISVRLMDPEQFATVVELSSEWREYALPFDGFVFYGRETEEPFDLDVLTHLQFFVVAPGQFDYWLDDIAFVRSE